MLGKDLSGYDFLSITKDGFVPMSVQPASDAQLSNVVFNECTKKCRVVTASHGTISVHYEQYVRGHRIF
jgi:hypothetical protein